MSNSIPRNHISIQAAPEVRQIAAPLFNHSQISYFSYSRFYQDNSAIVLHTHVPFFDAIIDNQFPMIGLGLENGIHLWDKAQSQTQAEFARQFNLGHGLIIVKKQDTFMEVFAFATHKDNPQMMEFYFNHMDILNKFCLYFKDKAYRLIQKAEKDKLIIPANVLNQTQNLDQKENTANRDAVKDTLNISHFYLDGNNEGISLTNREITCFRAFLRGLTALQIAKILGISPKSVETYLLKVKKKFACKNRSELIGKAWDLGILQSNGWLD